MNQPLDRAPIDEMVSGFAEQHHCPTVAWGVFDHGLLLAGSTPDTVYRIASMTKSFSAAATLWLRDAGVLRLDEAVATYAPELASLRSPTSDAPPVTVRDLLSMSSGLATDDPWADRHLDLTDEGFDAIIAESPVFAVATGSEFEYSNFGFAVLARVVQRASGRRIQDVVSEELLGPLGMRATTWVQPDHDDWAPPLQSIDDQFEPELPPVGDGLIAAMGGIWTTVSDLGRWSTWLGEAFPARDGHDAGPLSRASRREMQTVQRHTGLKTLRGVSSSTGYGYGLRVLEEPIGRVITHSGGLPGYGSNMRWLPGRGLSVVALSNVTYAPMTELSARILDVVVEQGFGARPELAVTDELRGAGQALVALFNDWNDTAADLLFADNVAPDQSYLRQRASLAALVGEHAPLMIADIKAVNAADATITLRDAANQALVLTYSLAPIRPVRIQEYDLSRPVHR